MGIKKQYIKDGEICTFTIVDGKVNTTIMIDGVWVCNPTIAQFEADEWVEYIPPTPPTPIPYVPTYAELVEQYIREHGYPTYGAELAIINNYATDPTNYADAYATYIQTRKEAKEWANNQPHREEDVI